VANVQPPPAWNGPPAGSSYSDPVAPLPSRRYMPSYHYRGQFVPPPGPDWPGAKPPQAPPPVPPPAKGMKPLERGRPVEVVPPPGIPVDHVKQPLTDKPQRGWRPVPGMGGMAMPQRLETPAILEQRPPADPPPAPSSPQAQP